MITARIETDSLSPDNVRLTTFVLTYPRFIHSELMTHRAFSRNAASSRAIPFDRMVRMIEENPAGPVKWGSKQPGMQSGDEIVNKGFAEKVWLTAMRDAVNHANQLDQQGVHKSISNRLLEPFAHMTTVVSATDYNNFFALRAHPAAQPEFQVLAFEMLERYLGSTPTPVPYRSWHVPFVKKDEIAERMTSRSDPELAWLDVIRMSTARCARTSYLNFKDSTLEKDVELHDRLSDDSAGHWSPFEHVARPIHPTEDVDPGNFHGWLQYRKTFPMENRNQVDLHMLLAARP